VTDPVSSDAGPAIHNARGPDAAFPLMLAALAGTLAAGLAAPFLTVDKWLWAEVHSVLGMAGGLWSDGDYFLFAVITLLVIVNPILKVLLLTALYLACPLGSRLFRRTLAAFELVSRFAMLDVFVLAIVVVALQPGGFFSIAVNLGAYAFAAHVGLSILAVRWLHGMARRLGVVVA